MEQPVTCTWQSAATLQVIEGIPVVQTTLKTILQQGLLWYRLIPGRVRLHCKLLRVYQ